MGLIMKFLDKIAALFDFPNAGKLVLRVGFSGMMLFHGIHKALTGTAYIQSLFVHLGMPSYFAYAVFLGEIIAPIMIILGLYTRIFAGVLIGTCLVVIGLVHMGDFFTLDKFGGWAVESIATYMFAAITLLFIGSGRFAVRPD